MRFTLQAISLLLATIFGIFLGIDTAEKNMQKMQGYEGAPRALQITPENGRVEISVLGHVYETENPLPKEKVAKKVEQTESEEEDSEEKNLLSRIGNGVGQGLEHGTRRALEALVSLLDQGP